MKIIRGTVETTIGFRRVFDDGYGNGFWFGVDENGALLPDTPKAAIDNLEWCLEHPKKFIRFNVIITEKSRYRNPDYGICRCGERVDMVNEYMGACECPRCGQWYNLYGQELKSPDLWDMDGYY